MNFPDEEIEEMTLYENEFYNTESPVNAAGRRQFENETLRYLCEQQ